MDSLPIFSAVITSRRPSSFFRPSMTFCALSKSGLSTVNEMSVCGVPVPWLMFWTIMSTFTTDKPDLLKAQKVIDGLKKEVGFKEVLTNEKIGKLSIVGVGMKSHTGVAGKLIETLAKEGVNIDMISTSEIKISVVIDLAKGEAAMKAVHAAFIG